MLKYIFYFKKMREVKDSTEFINAEVKITLKILTVLIPKRTQTHRNTDDLELLI